MGTHAVLEHVELLRARRRRRVRPVPGDAAAAGAASGNFTFSFQERHSFETSDQFYDGGVLEITQNDGANWSRHRRFATPGYAGTLFVGSSNPLGGRSAYVSTNAAYPGFTTVNVNLGTAYAGKTVKDRWRVATDEAAGDFGWAIDDLVFNNLVNQPFLALAAETGPCNLVAVGDDTPRDFGLALAGANPSRTLPALRFALPQAAHVTIGLYDVAGRRVAQLANEEFAAGWHTTPARAAELASGVYFARMDAAGRSSCSGWSSAVVSARWTWRAARWPLARAPSTVPDPSDSVPSPAMNSVPSTARARLRAALPPPTRV
jgi:hypothetical protein